MRQRDKGLIIGHYERAGEIKIGDTDLDSPSDREVARRERMNRKPSARAWLPRDAGRLPRSVQSLHELDS